MITKLINFNLDVTIYKEFKEKIESDLRYVSMSDFLRKKIYEYIQLK